MYKTDFILTYDIADEKRLGKISRYMEKNALRIQKSVYLCKQISKETLYEILQYLAEILDSQKDDGGGVFLPLSWYNASILS